MTEQHFLALLRVADAKRDGDWFKLRDGRQLTLYVASNGASLTVARVDALMLDGNLVQAKTSRGELFVFAIVDIYAGSTEAAQTGSRKAGFANG